MCLQRLQNLAESCIVRCPEMICAAQQCGSAEWCGQRPRSAEQKGDTDQCREGTASSPDTPPNYSLMLHKSDLSAQHFRLGISGISVLRILSLLVLFSAFSGLLLLERRFLLFWSVHEATDGWTDAEHALELFSINVEQHRSAS